MKDRASIHSIASSPASADRQMLAPVGKLRPSVWALRNEALLSPLISTGRNGLVSFQAVRSPGALRLHPAFNELKLDGWLINSECQGKPQGVREPILITRNGILLGGFAEWHLQGPSHWGITGVAVTPDGRRALSASWDDTLKVWDLDSGQELLTLHGHSNGVTGVAVMPDGRRALSASEDSTLKVWDLDRGQELLTLHGHFSRVTGVAVTPDGRRALSASWDKTLKVWDLDHGQELLTLHGHSGSVNGVAITPDGQRALSASEDKTLKVWDLDTGHLLASFTCEGGAYCCACVSNAGIVGGDAGGRIYLLSLEE